MAKKNSVLLDRRGVMKAGAAAAGAALLPSRVFAQAQPKKGGVLRVGMPYNPAALDPMTGRNLPDLNTLYAIFDPLIDFDPETLDPKPGLAKTWTFTDPKTLVLELVEGVKFHDGTDFDAEAAKLNLDRYKSDPRSNIKADLVTVEAVEINGPLKITLKLNRANAGLPNILTNRAGLMISPKSIKDAAGGNVDRNPVGTGAFKYVSWTDNDTITLTRNDKYWRQGFPYLDGITIKIINELNTIVRAAAAGEIDVGCNLQAPQKLAADRLSSLKSSSIPSLVLYGAFLNYSRPPFDDVRVRQAMNYAINREEINKIAAAGLGQPSCAPLPKEYWACDPATQNFYPYDPEKAKKLLTEAGHPNGIDVDCYGWADQLAMQRQEIVISQLAKAGIRVKLTAIAPQQASQAYMIEKKGAMLITPSACYPDPSQLYEQLFGANAQRNASGIELPGFRALMDATMEAQDREARKAAFVRLQRFCQENALQQVHYISPAVSVFNTKVRNYLDTILSVPKLADVWLDA